MESPHMSEYLFNADIEIGQFVMKLEFKIDEQKLEH